LTLYIQTPTVTSKIGQSNKRKVFLKLESLQPSGSFKLRGVSRYCEVRHAEGAKRFVSSSGGNAGLAVAYAGAALGVPVSVYVPLTTSERAKTFIREAGASVTAIGENWAQANAAALANMRNGDSFVHPFDDPLLWQGHGTMVDELVQQISKPDVIVCSVGGGGLLCGVVEGLRRNGWSDVPVIAVETHGAASYSAALKAGYPVDVSPINTVATSLGAPSVCKQALTWSRIHKIFSLVVDDGEAVKGSIELLREHRILTEPACGASIAALLQGLDIIEGANSVAVVVCGGVGTSAQNLAELLPGYLV
jgi:L-serine/L-threonine ammonia-lyase